MNRARPRVLVTGAAGRVGAALRPHLRSRYRLRLFDRLPIAPSPEGDEEVVTGDLGNSADLARALEDADAVIHLACVHGLEIDFEETLDVNYRSLVGLLDASARRGIKRFVYASSHHVLGMHPREGFDEERAEIAPDAFYGLSKAFGEAACSMYARRYGVGTLMIRIGNADPTVKDDRTLRMWVSGRDLASLMIIGLEKEDLGCEIVYGTSHCPRPLFDNRRALELGYAPLDRAEEHLDPAYLDYESMPPELGRDHVGGAYAAAPLPRFMEDS